MVALQDTGFSYFNSAAVDINGDIYTYGNFSGKVDFDPSASTFTLSSAPSSYDAFALKLTEGSLDIKAPVSQSEIICYPNPATKEIMITGITETYNAQLYNISGKKLSETFLKEPDQAIDMRPYAPGVYILKIAVAGKNFSFRVIKQ